MADRKTLKMLEKLAFHHGATEFGVSSTKTKRFYVVYRDKKINFGAKNGKTFIDHNDLDIRRAWRKRHSKILIGDRPAYKIKTSPEYWNWNLTW